MTKTIEEVKAAKRELELKISQMVNEFAEDYSCGLRVDVDEITVTEVGQTKTYIYVCRIDLKL